MSQALFLFLLMAFAILMLALAYLACYYFAFGVTYLWHSGKRFYRERHTRQKQAEAKRDQQNSRHYTSGL